MGELDEIGKRLLGLAAGPLFTAEGASVTYSFGPGAGKATIDGTVADRVAVEVESRVPKQVRGALVDLILHPYPSKLLLLLPVHTGNPATAVRQAEVILGRFLASSNFRVVVASDSVDDSVTAIRRALAELGVDVAVSVGTESEQGT